MIHVSLDQKVDLLGVKVTKLDQKIVQVDNSVTKLATDFFAFKQSTSEKLEKLDTIASDIDFLKTNVLWLVSAFKKFDEEHAVLVHQEVEDSVNIEKLKTRTDRIEDTLKLPKIKFSF